MIGFELASNLEDWGSGYVIQTVQTAHQENKKQHRRYPWSALFEGDIQTSMWLGNSRSESLLIFCWEYEYHSSFYRSLLTTG